MGSLQFICFLTGTFLARPLTYLCLPKSARADLFSQSVKILYFCSGPISVDPIGPQPSGPARGFGQALSIGVVLVLVVTPLMAWSAAASRRSSCPPPPFSVQLSLSLYHIHVFHVYFFCLSPPTLIMLYVLWLHFVPHLCSVYYLSHPVYACMRLIVRICTGTRARADATHRAYFAQLHILATRVGGYACGRAGPSSISARATSTSPTCRRPELSLLLIFSLTWS